MTDNISDQLDQIMETMEIACSVALEFHVKQLQHIRTGRPQPEILNSAKVDYHGEMVPIHHAASISVDQRDLIIKPWEKGMIKAIMKAISLMNQEYNPKDDGKIIRLTMPILTSERREALVREAKAETENAKVKTRNARRVANAELKKMATDKLISEDDDRDNQKIIQTLTDEAIAQMDVNFAEKEKKLRE